MKCKYDVVMFDLDGTLSDSAKGVRQCITLALQDMGKPVPNLSDVSLYVGPPLLETFLTLCKLDGEEAEEAMRRYREHYEKTGKYENRLYPGIDKVVEQVQKSGAKTVVATSKYEGFAYEVLKYIGILDKFDFICGSTADGTRKEKADIIRCILGRTCFAGIATERVVLVGDTKFDAIGARTIGCPFIGVTYGCGTKEQMKKEGAVLLSSTTEELFPLLFIKE